MPDTPRRDAIEAAARALAAEQDLDLDNLVARADVGDTENMIRAWRANFITDAEVAIAAALPDLHRAWAAPILKLHWEYEGRCANCITWCDCDSDIVDRHQHNVPWPCPTAKALDGASGTGGPS